MNGRNEEKKKIQFFPESIVMREGNEQIHGKTFFLLVQSLKIREMSLKLNDLEYFEKSLKLKCLAKTF